MKICLLCGKNEVCENNVYCIKCKGCYCYGMKNVFMRNHDRHKLSESGVYKNLVIKYFVEFYKRGNFKTEELKDKAKI